MDIGNSPIQKISQASMTIAGLFASFTIESNESDRIWPLISGSGKKSQPSMTISILFPVPVEISAS